MPAAYRSPALGPASLCLHTVRLPAQLDVYNRMITVGVVVSLALQIVLANY